MSKHMNIKTPREFFEKLPSRFDPKKAAGVDALIQMNVSGPDGGEWTLIVKDQALQIKEGKDPSAQITIEVADNDFVDLINGKLSGFGAFMSGKIQFKGSLSLGMRLMNMGLL